MRWEGLWGRSMLRPYPSLADRNRGRRRAALPAQPREVGGHAEQDAAEREAGGAGMLAQGVPQDDERAEDKEQRHDGVPQRLHGPDALGLAAPQREHRGRGERIDRESRDHE